MKFEPATIDILKNFATINTIQMFRKGATLKTRSPSKSVFAKANLKQSISRDFAIFDLARFLNTMSLFEEPDVVLDEQHCTIKKKDAAVRYAYADNAVVAKKISEQEVTLPEPYVTFTLNKDDYTALLKAMAVLGVPEMAIAGNGKNLALQALDSQKKKTRDLYCVTIGQTKKKFKAVISADNLKIIPQDYQVQICEGMAYFKSVDGSLEYWIALLAAESIFE